MTDIVDYNTVFLGTRKSFDIVMDNQVLEDLMPILLLLQIM